MPANEAIDKLHNAIWFFIDGWRIDAAGPWWEADLSLDIGLSLRNRLGDEGPVTLGTPPPFLRSWPPLGYRRLGTNNYFQTEKVVNNQEREQERPSEKLGKGRYPDHYYRLPGASGCEWVLELKLWSVSGDSTLEYQVRGCLDGFKQDARKWKGERATTPYAFVFLAVNIPEEFERKGKRPKTYGPGDFLKELINEIEGSTDLRELARGGNADACAVVKKVRRGSHAECVQCISTQRFAENSCRLSDLPVKLIGG